MLWLLGAWTWTVLCTHRMWLEITWFIDVRCSFFEFRCMKWCAGASGFAYLFAYKCQVPPGLFALLTSVLSQAHRELLCCPTHLFCSASGLHGKDRSILAEMEEKCQSFRGFATCHILSHLVTFCPNFGHWVVVRFGKFHGNPATSGNIRQAASNGNQTSPEGCFILKFIRASCEPFKLMASRWICH